MERTMSMDEVNEMLRAMTGRMMRWCGRSPGARDDRVGCAR